jgi:hypothetical protein
VVALSLCGLPAAAAAAAPVDLASERTKDGVQHKPEVSGWRLVLSAAADSPSVTIQPIYQHPGSVVVTCALISDTISPSCLDAGVGGADCSLLVLFCIFVTTFSLLYTFEDSAVWCRYN